MLCADVDVGGFAGGTKYLINNLFFKFPKDSQGLYGGDEWYVSALSLPRHQNVLAYFDVAFFIFFIFFWHCFFAFVCVDYFFVNCVIVNCHVLSACTTAYTNHHIKGVKGVDMREKPKGYCCCTPIKWWFCCLLMHTKVREDGWTRTEGFVGGDFMSC